MRFRFAVLIFVTTVLACTPHSKSSNAQKDPRAVVQAVLKAIETDDKTMVEQLMEPSRLQRLKPKLGQWMAYWKAYKVIHVGAVHSEKDSTAKVLVEYDSGTRKFTDSVGVKQIDGIWYWDEN